MKVKVNVGDWSGDGHSQCDTYFVEVPECEKTIDLVYKFGCEYVMVRMENYCSFYMDDEFPKKKLKRILESAEELGVSLHWDEYSELGNFSRNFGDGELINRLDEICKDCLHLSSPDYFTLWLAIANIGYKLLQQPAAIPVKEELPTYNIGGYGCFYF